jgi:hypothetical protein
MAGWRAPIGGGPRASARYSGGVVLPPFRSCLRKRISNSQAITKAQPSRIAGFSRESLDWFRAAEMSRERRHSSGGCSAIGGNSGSHPGINPGFAKVPPEAG